MIRCYRLDLKRRTSYFDQYVNSGLISNLEGVIASSLVDFRVR